MNKYVVSLACAILLVSCAGTPSPTANAAGSPAVQPAATAAKASTPKTVTVRVPQERKASVMFADGSLDEYMVSEYDASGLQTSRSRFTASGALVERTDMVYAGGKLQVKSLLDGDQKLTSKTLYRWNPAGQLVGSTLEDGNGKRLSSYAYAYDGGGNRTEWVVMNGADKVVARTAYAFKNAKVVSAENQDSAGTKMGSATYEYDASGNLIAQKFFDAKGTLLRTENSIWKDGFLVEENKADPSGKVFFKVSYAYGPDREITKKTVDDIAGKVTYSTVYEYTVRLETRTVEQ